MTFTGSGITIRTNTNNSSSPGVNVVNSELQVPYDTNLGALPSSPTQ